MAYLTEFNKTVEEIAKKYKLCKAEKWHLIEAATYFDSEENDGIYWRDIDQIFDLCFRDLDTYEKQLGITRDTKLAFCEFIISQEGMYLFDSGATDIATKYLKEKEVI